MAEPRNGWKTLRVVVEIAVQGDLTEKDLVSELKAELEDGYLTDRLEQHRPHHIARDAFGETLVGGPQRARTGRLHVKQFSRVKAALTRTIFGRL